jgi:predicted ATP-dependent endonuclease of OLD family
MKLKCAHIKEFKSVWDSNSFQLGNITCLVGKNEAGKTALLQALYRLNPIIESDASFDPVDDYPRSEVENYQQSIETGRRKPATVIEAVFTLDPPELEAIEEEYGSRALSKPEITASRGYVKAQLYVHVPVMEAEVVRHFLASFGLPEPVRTEAAQKGSLSQLNTYLNESGQKHAQAVAAAQAAANQLPEEEKAAALEQSKSLAESEQAKALRAKLAALPKDRALGIHIWDTILKAHFPKFLYFDEYYQMVGHENVQALKERKTTNKLKESDYPLLGLIELARLDLDKLLAASRTQELKNKLQGASNHLTQQVLKYWSQNKHLRMDFDVRAALPGDPVGMQQGTNIWGEVFDAKHQVSTGLSTRSRGFVWFFSFLAWYSAEKKKDQSLVLLLDEPGLSLHGKAQEDLLRYFDAEVITNPKHQLVYSTHSPFMIDPLHFDRVRIVQDRSIDVVGSLPREEDGTKVLTDVLDAGPDSLFPLQGALGYEIYQTLFVGPNSLIVEGVSDLLYIQTISGALQAAGRVGIDPHWTITPVGGSDKVPTFVALVGAQKNLNVATLVDFQKADQQMIENLYKRRLLKKSHVLTFADFTGTSEADIEDMFDEAFYLQLVSEEFAGSLSSPLTPSDLVSRSPRVLVRLGDHLSRAPLKGGASFNHYRPARYFAEKAATLKIPEATLNRFEAAFKAANALLKHADAVPGAAAA